MVCRKKNENKLFIICFPTKSPSHVHCYTAVYLVTHRDCEVTGHKQHHGGTWMLHVQFLDKLSSSRTCHTHTVDCIIYQGNHRKCSRVVDSRWCTILPDGSWGRQHSLFVDCAACAVRHIRHVLRVLYVMCYVSYYHAGWHASKPAPPHHPSSPTITHHHPHHPPPPTTITQLKNSVGDDVRENVFVCADEQHELTGSRGTANFTLKWEKDSKKESCMCVLY